MTNTIWWNNGTNNNNDNPLLKIIFPQILDQFFFYRFNELSPPSSLVYETFSAGRKSTDQFKTFQ